MENLENRYNRKTLTLNIEGKDIKGTVIEYRTCEHEGSFYGDTIDKTIVFQDGETTYKRTFKARGAGLERISVDWSITTNNELLKKIRRRVEDRLRKADQYEILKCAHSLGVKMT